MSRDVGSRHFSAPVLMSKWRIIVEYLVLNFVFPMTKKTVTIYPECMNCHGVRWKLTPSRVATLPWKARDIHLSALQFCTRTFFFVMHSALPAVYTIYRYSHWSGVFNLLKIDHRLLRRKKEDLDSIASVIKAARLSLAQPERPLCFTADVFFSEPDLWGSSADGRESFPRDRKWVGSIL